MQSIHGYAAHPAIAGPVAQDRANRPIVIIDDHEMFSNTLTFVLRSHELDARQLTTAGGTATILAELVRRPGSHCSICTWGATTVADTSTASTSSDHCAHAAGQWSRSAAPTTRLASPRRSPPARSRPSRCRTPSKPCSVPCTPRPLASNP
jgi:hypothetical protein